MQIGEDLCQEDWGVAIIAQRNQKKVLDRPECVGRRGAWLAHFHHGSFAWLQWFSLSGKKELRRLLVDVHDVLASDTAISEIAWHEESERGKPQPAGFPTPVED